MVEERITQDKGNWWATELEGENVARWNESQHGEEKAHKRGEQIKLETQNSHLTGTYLVMSCVNKMDTEYSFR